MNDYLKIGDIFDDRYEILELLGSGGVGTVYKALQIDCGRLVALKVLHQNTAADEEYRARFLREAQALSKLSHINIVTVYHLGVTSTAMPYLAMEYLKGENLRAVIKSRDRLPVIQSLRIIRDAARALHYTHQQGIIHRDLKPENMILSPLPEPDTLKLLDFGLARLSDQQNPQQRLTRTGEIIGTSAYMSPEQCMGKPVDFRTDIYSLSVCLYEIMVGQKALDADTAIGLMYKHINEPVPEIKAEQVDHFDGILNEIIARGMSKEPENRYASMEAMADQLDRAISSLQATAKVNPAKKRLTIAVTIVALLFLAIPGLIVGIKIALDQNKANRTQTEFVVLTEQDKISHAIERLKTRLGSQQEPSTIKSPTLKERYLKELFALARLQLSSSHKQDLADAEKTCSDALQFCKRCQEFKQERPYCLTLMAKSEWKQDKFDAADRDFNEAIKLVSNPGSDRRMFPDILAERTIFRLEQRNFKAASADLISAIEPFQSLSMEQIFDRYGNSRFDLFRQVALELAKIEPRSTEDRVQIVKMSNAVATLFLRWGLRTDAVKNAEFSGSLLKAVEGEDELKKETKALELRCWKIGSRQK